MNQCLLATALLAATFTASGASNISLHQEYLQAKKEMTATRATETLAATADTGDADSFGRNVKYIGLMSSGLISLASDCTPDPASPPGPDDHCFVTNPAPLATSFVAHDVARVLIPAKSTNSLICHWQTPIVVYAFNNPTAAYQSNARFTVTPTYTIQNSVLNDPALIDPNTGAPFAGSFTTSLVGIRRARSLQPGEFQIERETGTRACIAGIVSKRSLIEGYGLSATQAANFFKNDTIITMGLQGNASLVNFASIIYGTRFVGD